ncbi:MAG TPA: hypothetical protein VGN98_14175 [Tianweitania sediminis]|jgi:hypothetical protein|nr:hypothetical protein [Tianweitania sediminis]
MRDLYSNIGAKVALKPAVVTAAGNGEAIDTHGFGRVAFAIATGAVAGSGDFGVKLQESDNGSTGWSDVTDAHQLQSNAPATLEADSAYRVGYLGHKRYVRLAVTKAGGTSVALAAIAITGNNASRPVA